MKARSLIISAVGTVAVLGLSSLAYSAQSGGPHLGDHLVGRQGDGTVLTAENKFIDPLGTTIEQSGQVMDLAIRPDGQTAVDLTASGNSLLTVVDLANHKVVQTYTPVKGDGTIGVGGVLYSADGSQVWVAQTTDLLRLDVAADGTLSNPAVVRMPTSTPGGIPTGADGYPAAPLPSGLTWAPDGTTILVTLSGWNALAAISSTTGKTRWQAQVGMAPRDVVVSGGKAFVSNEAGRTPRSGDFTNYSYDSAVVADRTDGRAASGTVSAISLQGSHAVRSITTGLDPSALLVDDSNVLVTNSSDDTVSVIDSGSGKVTRTFNVNPLPGQPFGSSPNALVRLDQGHLAVSLGRDNALAVYAYTGGTSTPVFDGLIPTAWYPGKVFLDRQLGKLVVGNLKGVGALDGKSTISEGPGTKPATGRQVYNDKGVVQVLAVPKPRQMAALTARVFSLNQWNGLKKRSQGGSTQVPAVPVPQRVGDPSPIKHVFVIVRENRTYDQELGDLPQGNGDAKLTQFGERVTPNAHALARQFGTIDNLYSEGTNSATGHTWLDAAWVNDYLERSYANYVRDYGQPDAMVYPKSGFLWDDATAHGLSARVWGEYAEYYTGPNGQPATGDWKDWYRDSQILEGQRHGKLHAPLGYYTTKADVPSLNKILAPDFPNFETQIPDQYRADLFLRDLKGYEKRGTLPALNMMWVMCDHTTGTVPGYPTPAAQVADNDLATGRIVDAISHSKFWKSTAIFIVEDDSQNGVDHVDGHRNVLLVASPYARRGAVIHDYYSQANVTRTVEQILGLPPMNQIDLAAQPMDDVFTDKPDFTPYTFHANRIPLDTMNATLKQAKSPIQREWIRWSGRQDFSRPDMLSFEAFNRLTWYSTYHFARPYPGDAKVLSPAEVVARFPQTAMTSDPDGTLPQTRAQLPHVAGR